MLCRCANDNHAHARLHAYTHARMRNNYRTSNDMRLKPFLLEQQGKLHILNAESFNKVENDHGALNKEAWCNTPF